MKKIIASLSTLIFSVVVFASVTLPKIFDDNMVLQRNKPISIWGWVIPNENLLSGFTGKQNLPKQIRQVNGR